MTCKAVEPMRVDMTDLARHALVEAGGFKSEADVVIAPLPEAWADPDRQGTVIRGTRTREFTTRDLVH